MHPTVCPRTTNRPAPTILAIEPIYSDFTHALGNAYQLEALTIGRGESRIVFAAHPGHFDAVRANVPSLATDLEHFPIDVVPAGGIKFSRYRSQLREMLRAVDASRPDCVICLAVTPETLFACVTLRLRHPTLPVIAVLHGDLSKVIGWRSRDPRRRLFDQQSAIRLATWAGLRFAVLEDYVRRAAMEFALLPPSRVDVWPHPIGDRERVPEPPPLHDGPVRLGFLGFAKREKGFDDFLSLIAHAEDKGADWCEFRLIGTVADEKYQDLPPRLTVVPGVADRDTYVDAVRSIDYACVFLDSDIYRLTSSGSVIDAIAALRPMIGLETPATRAMFDGRAVGYFCRDRNELRALIDNPATLSDPVRYRAFQDGLLALGRGRKPAELAGPIAATIRTVMRRTNSRDHTMRVETNA